MSKNILILILGILVIVGGLLVYMFVMAPSTEKKVLKVGTSADFPPFEYIDNETGEIVGFDIELIKELAKSIGYDEVEIVNMQFDALIPALDRGDVDVVIAGMTITAERQQIVDFTNPYWEADQSILVKKNGGYNPQTVSDLNGHTIGVQSGTTGEWLIDELISNGTLTNVDVRRYPSFVHAVTDLVNGQIDAVIIDKPAAQQFTKQYNVEVSAVIKTGEKYGIAVKKGRTELLNKLNSALQAFMGSDKWNSLVNKYFGS